MQIGIYVDNQTSLENLEEAVNLMKTEQEDIFLFTDDQLFQAIPMSELACINFSHILHYYGKILFMNPKDFNKKSRNLHGIIAVISKKEDLLKLDAELIKTKKAQVIIKDKKGLREAKNAELQQLTR